jgi:hypothetical protein
MVHCVGHGEREGKGNKVGEVERAQECVRAQLSHWQVGRGGTRNLFTTVSRGAQLGPSPEMGNFAR